MTTWQEIRDLFAWRSSIVARSALFEACRKWYGFRGACQEEFKDRDIFHSFVKMLCMKCMQKLLFEFVLRRIVHAVHTLDLDEIIAFSSELSSIRSKKWQNCSTSWWGILFGGGEGGWGDHLGIGITFSHLQISVYLRPFLLAWDLIMWYPRTRKQTLSSNDHLLVLQCESI